MLATNQCFILNEDENRHIERIICQLQTRFTSIENNAFQDTCSREVLHLPFRLLSYLNEIAANRMTEGFYIISGFEIEDDAIGNTPEHWDTSWKDHSHTREEIYQCLISSAIGHLFGWRTQENGRFLRHIIPIKKEANEQLGGSSTTTLVWHTEEAFHPARADYMSLMCYRNNEKAETIVSNVRQLKLPEETKKILKQDRFYVEPDTSHLPKSNVSNQWQMDNSQFAKILENLSKPRKCAVLHGSEEYPLMVVDQAFMHAAPGDHEAEAALHVFHDALDESVNRVVMKPGELLIIDNLTTAHGRAAYKPDYGPKQRWMRRVNIRNGRRAFHEYIEASNTRIMM